MTALPQLVAAFHSLVGLAAVFVATSAFYSPGSYGIVNEYNEIFPSSLVEMSIGVAIFLFFFGMAFWVLLFLFGFIGVWVNWGLIEITKAQLAKRGLIKDV